MRRHEFDGLSPSQIWVWHILPTIRWKTPNKSGPGATGCQWVLLGATRCYWALLGTAGYCWVLLYTWSEDHILSIWLVAIQLLLTRWVLHSYLIMMFTNHQLAPFASRPPCWPPTPTTCAVLQLNTLLAGPARPWTPPACCAHYWHLCCSGTASSHWGCCWPGPARPWSPPTCCAHYWPHPPSPTWSRSGICDGPLFWAELPAKCTSFLRSQPLLWFPERRYSQLLWVPAQQTATNVYRHLRCEMPWLALVVILCKYT